MDNQLAINLIGSLRDQYSGIVVSLLPVLFGVLVIASAIAWGYNSLIGFFSNDDDIYLSDYDFGDPDAEDEPDIAQRLYYEERLRRIKSGDYMLELD